MEIQNWKFPAGEVGVRVIGDVEDNHTLDWVFKGSDDIIYLMLLVDALRRKNPKVKLSLLARYFPYARQDRVCAPGESHSLKVIADLINSLKFEEVTVVDPHSTVLEAVLNNLKIIPQHQCVVATVPKLESYDYFIAPDAGAAKKIYELAKLYKKPVIIADKTRDPTTGDITGYGINNVELLLSKKALVVDDICDGGRTFIELAKAIPVSTILHLYVTHGIFSKGKQVLSDSYDEIFCYNDMSSNYERKE